jgi:hypothetical protein
MQIRFGDARLALRPLAGARASGPQSIGRRTASGSFGEVVEIVQVKRARGPRSGKRSSGKRSSGKRSSGKRSSGKRSSGKRSSGKRSSGKRSSGKRRGEPGTPERPFFRRPAQPGLNRVRLDVADNVLEVAFVSNVPIEVILLPKLSRAAEELVGSFCGERLPGPQDARQALFRVRRQQSVNVIGHHDPRVQVIANPFEAQESLLNAPRDMRVAEVARPVPRVSE